MPELPEVEVVRRSLAPRLIGRRVVAVTGSGLALRRPVALGDWRTAISGRVCSSLDRRGKYLIATFDSVAAVLHLGMSGRLILASRGTPPLPHTHLALDLDDGHVLRFVDPRRFGIAVVVANADLSRVPPLAGLGPEPLGPDLGPALLAARDSRVAIRNVLLDQRVVAGVGNIYANEALFRAGIHPGRPARRIGADRLARLAICVRSVLEDAIAAGGTTLADGGFVDGAGEAGYFAVDLAVYGREGSLCPRCGGVIRRVVLGARSAFYCPRCQR